jgi:hypothetical protein
MPTITPNPKKALFLAKKQLSELVYDAVNLEGVNYTLPEVQTLLDGVTVGGHRQTDAGCLSTVSRYWYFIIFKKLLKISAALFIFFFFKSNRNIWLDIVMVNNPIEQGFQKNCRMLIKKARQ